RERRDAVRLGEVLLRQARLLERLNGAPSLLRREVPASRRVPPPRRAGAGLPDPCRYVDLPSRHRCPPCDRQGSGSPAPFLLCLRRRTSFRYTPQPSDRAPPRGRVPPA